MFERNRVDNTLQQMTVPAEITLADGQVRKGKFIVSAARSIFDVLNGDTKFLDFETFDGDRSLIAKSTLASITMVSAPSTGGLKARLQDGGDFDPYAILGVSQGTSWEDVRAAYLKLSKIYHPDLFLSVALPPEVRDYLAAMARRINSAYRALEVPQQAAKRAVIEKAKPIFTSPQRL
ncbi:MAG: J domain-containing protein [Hyphomicrobium sp.]|nr:J domain-containing protein [Hyphomicrobium sp.]